MSGERFYSGCRSNKRNPNCEAPVEPFARSILVREYPDPFGYTAPKLIRTRPSVLLLFLYDHVSNLSQQFGNLSLALAAQAEVTWHSSCRVVFEREHRKQVLLNFISLSDLFGQADVVFAGVKSVVQNTGLDLRRYEQMPAMPRSFVEPIPRIQNPLNFVMIEAVRQIYRNHCLLIAKIPDVIDRAYSQHSGSPASTALSADDTVTQFKPGGIKKLQRSLNDRPVPTRTRFCWLKRQSL